MTNEATHQSASKSRTAETQLLPTGIQKMCRKPFCVGLLLFRLKVNVLNARYISLLKGELNGLVKEHKNG